MRFPYFSSIETSISNGTFSPLCFIYRIKCTKIGKEYVLLSGHDYIA